MSEPRQSTRLRLEELEDRLTPSPIIAGTSTNASVQVTPNLLAGTVTEQVTVSVTTAPQYSSITGKTTPVPAGAGTPSGTVLINLNNQQQQLTLDAKGQATATFTLPLLSVLSSQELAVSYTGSFDSTTNDYEPSAFNAPLFMNFNNMFLPATLTFSQLTPQQQAPTVNSSLQLIALPSLNTAQGETDDFGVFAFKYSDPGVISSVDLGGLNLPGMFAMALGAYGPSLSSANA